MTATLGQNTVKNVNFMVYLMEVTITAPPPVIINYKVGNPKEEAHVDLFSITSDPNPPGYWDDPTWTYNFNHPDGVTAVDPAFFIKFSDTTPPNNKIGTVSVHTTLNVKYFDNLS